MPGIGDEIDGAMQQAPQSARQADGPEPECPEGHGLPGGAMMA